MIGQRHKAMWFIYVGQSVKTVHEKSCEPEISYLFDIPMSKEYVLKFRFYYYSNTVRPTDKEMIALKREFVKK